MLPNYFQYFCDNPNSQIAQIVGLYTFERADSLEQYSIIIMEVVCSVPIENILRVYDVKGSDMDRQVIASPEQA